MIDGIKIFAKIHDFEVWKQKTGIDLSTPIGLDTGELKGRKKTAISNITTYHHWGVYETYKLKVKQTDTYSKSGALHTKYNLLIEGSLHKNFYGGHNYKRFTFNDMQTEINKLCKGLFLNPKECKIQNLEIGVNVVPPFVVEEFLENSLLLHSVKAFENYDPDKNQFILGKLVRHSQHSVKCYNKGAQYGLEYPLMRFEDRCTKMQYLSKFRIKTINDLTDYSKVYKLGELLTTVWKDVLINETDVESTFPSLTLNQSNLVRDGQYRDYWTKLHKSNRMLFNKHRTKFRELMVRHSKMGYYSQVEKLIQEEWRELAKIEW